MIQFIKVPIGIYRRSNDLGRLNDFLFYCAIKGINREGFLVRGRLIDQIKEVTGFSESNIRLKISRLKKIGWIDIFKNGSIGLKKYDVVWNSIGIFKVKGDFLKILKIKRGSLKQIKEEIQLEEIKDCLSRQSKTMVESFFEEIGLGDIEKKPNSKNSKIKKRVIRKTNFERLFLKRVKKHSCIKSFSTNYDVTLSCIGVSKLLGYTSAMQGYYIERKLMESKKIDIKRRTVFFMKGNFSELPSSFFHSGNCVIRQLPNKIIIL